jgi:hypothetical protein
MSWNWRRWLRPGPRTNAGAGFSSLGAGLIAVLMVGLGYVRQNHLSIPPNTLPWQPVELNSPPGWMTHWQMRSLFADAGRCRAALRGSPETVVAIQDQTKGEACGYTNVVRAVRSPIVFSPRTTATCGLTAGLVWYQDLLQQAAQAHMHARLMRIDQLGTFACRNVNSETVGPRSQHAYANAIDISAFHFADGHTVTVAHDYGADSPGGHFLDAAHDAACTVFNTVLGPRYNRLHANHFHLDQGPYTVCS